LFTHKEHEIVPEEPKEPSPTPPSPEPEEEEEEGINWIPILIKGGINSATLPLLATDLAVNLGYLALAAFDYSNQM
jgi:hypothetical protein